MERVVVCISSGFEKNVSNINTQYSMAVCIILIQTSPTPKSDIIYSCYLGSGRFRWAGGTEEEPGVSMLDVLVFAVVQVK